MESNSRDFSFHITLPQDKTNKMICAPNKDSDQPGHQHLIWAYTVCPDLAVQKLILTVQYYRNDPKFSDRQVWANSADPEEQSDQGLHCLPCHLRLLDALLYGKPSYLNSRVITANFSGAEILGIWGYTWWRQGTGE